MASQSYDPQTDWRGCIDARYIPLDTLTNPDMDGIAVAFATAVVSLCLRIKALLSPADFDDVEVIASITQSYFILLSTLFSINRQQLSLFDAHYALVVISSPLTSILVVVSICNLLGFEKATVSGFLGFKNPSFERTRSHRHIIRILGALLLLLMFGLRLVLRLSSRAFIDSELCSDATFEDLLFDLFVHPFTEFGEPTLADPVVTMVFVLFIMVLKSLIVIGKFLVRQGKALELLGWLRIRWTPMKSTWHTAYPYNKWLGYILIIWFDAYWAADVITRAFSASGKEYVMSYGQLLPLFAAAIPLMSTAKLVYGKIRICVGSLLERTILSIMYPV